MSKQIVITMGVTGGILRPMRETLKIVDVGIATAVDEVSVYIGDNVNESRQAEIVNAWRWLYNGLMDRNLLEGQFKGLDIYSGSNIKFLTAIERRTSVPFATILETDVGIGIGSAVTAFGGVTMILTAIQLLQDFALEKNWLATV
jgi:hypothetical protein